LKSEFGEKLSEDSEELDPEEDERLVVVGTGCDSGKGRVVMVEKGRLRV
jgi:hypothetical protein